MSKAHSHLQNKSRQNRKRNRQDNEDNDNKQINLVIFGPGCVGKTEYCKAIEKISQGVNYSYDSIYNQTRLNERPRTFLDLEVDQGPIRVQLIDCPGQLAISQFENILESEDPDGVILQTSVDLESRMKERVILKELSASVEKILNEKRMTWQNKIMRYNPYGKNKYGIPLAYIVNKIDRDEDKNVPMRRLCTLQKEYCGQCKIFEMSVWEGLNLKEPIDWLISQITSQTLYWKEE